MDNSDASEPVSPLEVVSSMTGQMELPLGEALEGQLGTPVCPDSPSGRQRRWTLENIGEPHQKGWGRHKSIAEYNACLWCQPL